MPCSRDADDDAAGVVIDAMTSADVDDVLTIERDSFSRPWLREHFLHELQSNPVAVNRVLRLRRRVVGYVCAWHVAGELKINNLAVDPALRGRGLARRLLRAALEEARRAGCVEASLEVRPSNAAARALYESAGFALVGRRPNYYAADGEDGLLMARPL